MKSVKFPLAVALTGAVIVAYAQTNPGTEQNLERTNMPCMDGSSHELAYHHGGHMRPDRWERMTQRKKQLHDKLKLNSEQEKAWQVLESATKAPAESKPFDEAEMAKMSAPVRMEKMMERMKLHQDAMGERLAAVKKFYGTLNADQKKTFDQQTLPRHGKFRHGTKAMSDRDLPPAK